MLTRKSFIKKVKDLGYKVVEEENEIKINKKNVTYAVAGDVEQYSITFKNTPANLKSLVREYEDTRIDKRSGYYVIPLKNLTLGGQKYITFNRVTEQFGVSTMLPLTEDVRIIFTKEEIESDFFKEQLENYIEFVEEY